MSKHKAAAFVVLTFTLLWLGNAQTSILASPLAPASQNSAPPAGNLTPTPSPTSALNCNPTWQLVDTPNNPNNPPNSLAGVAALAPDDVWTVGGDVYTTSPLAERWSGAGFSMVPTDGGGYFRGIAAVAPNNIWAVGANDANYTTLVEHWDGSAWSIVPSPNPTYDSRLYAVSAISTDNIWAVGMHVVITEHGGVYQTLVEHWDGLQWSVIPSPNINPPGDYLPNDLEGVTAISANDVWAVGIYVASDTGLAKGLTEHWDGTSWQVVTAPFIGQIDQLWAVSASGSDNVWAVGDYGDSANGGLLTLHWDGSAWQQVQASFPATGTNGLHGVLARAPNDVWAVGDYFTRGSGQPNHTLVEHWDGTSWQVVPSESDPTHADTLLAISASSATDMWAVGERWPEDPGVVVLHYTTPPQCVTPSPTAIATDTPIATPTSSPTPTPIASNTATALASATPTFTPSPTPSATSTAVPSDTPTAMPTATPAATPTDCANGFVDVQGNIFYPAIHALNCAGVINGSDASHYAPAGTATRAQFAKIVVLGFGLPISTPATPDFTDVAPGYFAYAYIESGYANHILSGFDAQSCAAAHALYPCYLPNLAISRAQLTKLVVGAAGYALLTPAQPSFSDVPPTNVFYAAIETAHAHGVVNGYPDGTFRPSRSIRRDEMAGIVFTAINTP